MFSLGCSGFIVSTSATVQVIDQKKLLSEMAFCVDGPLNLTHSFAACGLRDCKNRPAPFPGRMSYKATKPGLVCLSIP